MLGRTPFMTFLTYAVLIAGVALVALPVWVTFVASTQTLDQVLATPMSLLPGDRLLANYAEVLSAGAGNTTAPVARMLFNSLVMALAIALGKIAISLLSAFALLVFAPLVFAVEPPEHAASTVAAAASAVTASKARERCLMTEPFLVQDFRNRMARR